MITLVSIVAIGFFLGMRHATDPDHVIAVTTIVSRQRRAGRAALIGLMWGLGHTLTVLAVGSAIIAFNLAIPARLGLTMELMVGLMLILLGAWNVAGYMRAQPASGDAPAVVHTHAHAHGDYIHTHPHSHGPETHPHAAADTLLARLDRFFGALGAYQVLRPLVIGIVHGLAGSAAIALLILASIRNPRWALAYLLVFGIGTIAGMMLITMSLASAFRFAAGRFRGFGRRLALVSGVVSVVFGVVLAYQICVAQGLFAASPHWTPR